MYVKIKNLDAKDLVVYRVRMPVNSSAKHILYHAGHIKYTKDYGYHLTDVNGRHVKGNKHLNPDSMVKLAISKYNGLIQQNFEDVKLELNYRQVGAHNDE